ncbi:hypothetical protein HU200_003199 [Digitaria exilis]|uniref:Uncharacterized protein n=1 Tax=Digitaria exilis TaxID=1010633 RepID=A0A835FVD9_9POAL|nr:hypothetical protein HU200_003199 [Digitaria exilis]CAB3462221.1 unnamed protein product [Digitaria exilis]
MDEKVGSLELELKVALAKNHELEAQVMAKKREYDLVKIENDNLLSEVLNIEKKHVLSEPEVKEAQDGIGCDNGDDGGTFKGI